MDYGGFNILQDLIYGIEDFTLNCKYNIVKDTFQIFDRPLIGIADASDPLWDKLKEPEVIGSHHLNPKEWLPTAKSVISYFLPFTKHVYTSNHSDGLPSKEWLYGRCEGEIFNNELRSHIIELLKSKGGVAMAPALDKRFANINHKSNWSERHVAFISGLGTFGLSHTLITNMGTAGRFGSVIVDMEFEPKERVYKEIEEYCAKCGTCINRCPIQAINEDYKDKESCSIYLDKMLKLNKPRYGCGKCQTAVPCEHMNPTR